MTNIDKVRICGLALANIGSPPIMSINEKGPKAEACRLHYDVARIEALSAAPWSFAKRFVTPPQLAVTPLKPYSYAYSYPADALRIHEIARAIGQPPIPFEVTDQIAAPGKQINTNELAPMLIYTVDKADESAFDMEFVVAFAWLLASKIAMPITKNPKLQDAAWKQWIAMKSITIAANFNEETEDVEQEPFYQAVR